jgi:YD repeat-containing protein
MKIARVIKRVSILLIIGALLFINVIPSFALTTYTITGSAGSGGSIFPSGASTVYSGGIQTYTMIPDIGHVITDVLVDNVSVGPVVSYTFSNVKANHTISASFIAAHTITAWAADINGSVSPSGIMRVYEGSNKTFTITPNSGYIVSNVKVDWTSVGAVTSYTFTNITASHTINASFVAGYVITALAGSGGSISPAGSISVTKNSSETFTISPNSGYVVADVQVDGSSVGAVTTYTFSNVTANHAISATFIVTSVSGNLQYDYDDLNRLYKIENTDTGQTVEYQYDEVGNRIQKGN